MPYKHLTAPKTIATLDGEIVATAQLESANWYAVLTNDPVCVTMFPTTGGATKGKSTNVSLHNCQEVALINRDVAVVRSDDDLWALLDIQHTAKMDQVGRDIRWLRGCPRGEKALAIGWDGQGAALSLRQYEVGGRQFTVRGEIRACDMGATETYVVAEAGGAGQFRAHPGGTPESGAKARADLPADAKSFDQLVGGPQLAAVYKKGSANVCIVTRDSSNNASAKMVMLDVPPLSLTVAATSLFSVADDGRVRLFNAEALNKAEADVPMDPTAAVDTPARAEPTVLDATTKGGTKIWLGSKAGDVIQLNATKAGLDSVAL